MASKNKSKSTIPRDFWGIVKTLQEGNMTRELKIEIYYFSTFYKDIIFVFPMSLTYLTKIELQVVFPTYLT